LPVTGYSKEEFRGDFQPEVSYQQTVVSANITSGVGCDSIWGQARKITAEYAKTAEKINLSDPCGENSTDLIQLFAN
jgi:hypothetical protein